MSDLYLVRHGQASFGTDDYDRLSAIGREQALLLAAHFNSLGRRVDAFYSGPMRRQRDTARLIAGACSAAGGGTTPAPEPVVLEGLAEYDADVLLRAYLASRRAAGDGVPVPGGAKALDRRGFQTLLEAAGLAWIAGEFAGQGESWPAFRARVGASIAAIREREGRGRTIVAAVSAGVVGAALGCVLGLSDREALASSWVVHNSAVTLLRYDDRRTSLASFNVVGHLERDRRLDLITYR